MNRHSIFVLLALLSPHAALADVTPYSSQTPGQLCRQAIAAAERAHGIPSHLLAAIARVESGRRDQASGGFNPWPWTINADGQGSFYDTKGQAVAAALSMRSKATRSVDVGCMQISLMYHPNAFSGMDTAFDPAANAEYGARFLVQLFEKTHSWPRAVELYHSATPEIGQEYQRRVYAAWPEEQKFAEMTTPAPPSSVLPAMGGRSQMWTALRPSAARVLPQATGLDGAAAPGRTLDAYRLTPVRMTSRVR
jgi:hypothetical protein